jgi:hypothetical protein
MVLINPNDTDALYLVIGRQWENYQLQHRHHKNDTKYCRVPEYLTELFLQ